MLPDPPLPILARRLAGPARIEVTFDQQLQPGPIDHTNWDWRWTNIHKNGQIPATVAGNLATVREQGAALDIGPDEVNYTAAVPDIVNLFGTPAVAFAGFPLV